MKDNITKLDYEQFLISFKQNLRGSFAFLLGAGASKSSGVPTADECMWEWKHMLYEAASKSHTPLPTPKISTNSKRIIQQWIERQPGFPQAGDEEEYSFYAEKAFPIESDRIKYFENLFVGKVPSIGYQIIVLLNKYGLVKTIWTTNFDGLAERAAQMQCVTPIAVNLDNCERIYRPDNSQELLCVSLHGDYKYSSLKNSTRELESQNDIFVEMLRHQLSTQHLIILGYSGRDKSLMDALAVAYSAKGAGRLYWCGYGDVVPNSVQHLINTCRENGREAYYVPTNGFDDTLLRMFQFAYSEECHKLSELDQLIKSSDFKESPNTPFSIDIKRCDGYLRSNLHPIKIPCEIFQFRYKQEPNIRPWKMVREILKQNPVKAVPFQENIYTWGTLSDINRCFAKIKASDVMRTPLTPKEVIETSAFKSIVLDSILYCIAQRDNSLGIIYSEKLLFDTTPLEKTADYTKYEAINLGLQYHEAGDYLLLSFKPTLFIRTHRDDYAKERLIPLYRSYLDNKRNREYEGLLTKWEARIFNGRSLSMELPKDSQSGFSFQIGARPAYAHYQDIKMSGGNSVQAQNVSPKAILYNGVLLEDPKLVFGSTDGICTELDANPMRGLVNNAPYDFPIQCACHRNVRLGAICPSTYGNKFNAFIQGITTRVEAKQYSDYIQTFPGFYQAFKTDIELPSRENGTWATIKVMPKNAQELVHIICAQAQNMANRYPDIVIVICIPKAWSQYRTYESNGETFDLHNHIKAYCAQNGIATQLIEEKTLSKSMLCEKYWWLSLAIYVKALQSPWALADFNSETAYAGVGFSLRKHNGKTQVVLGCSHIYNSQGQGLRYRLSPLLNPQFEGKNPYMDFNDAFRFGLTINELFLSAMDKAPKRVVIHKRTPFKESEIQGLLNAFSQIGIKDVDLITIEVERNARFTAQLTTMGNSYPHNFPLQRGMCLVVSSNKALLWTHGCIDSCRSTGSNHYHYYPGGKGIPSPLSITRYYGKTDIKQIASEILGFSKMNWNSFNPYTKLPSTIDTSNALAQVGNLLRHYKGVTYDYRYFI